MVEQLKRKASNGRDPLCPAGRRALLCHRLRVEHSKNGPKQMLEAGSVAQQIGDGDDSNGHVPDVACGYGGDCR